MVETLIDKNKKMKNKTNLQDENEYHLANRQLTAAYRTQIVCSWEVWCQQLPQQSGL